MPEQSNFVHLHLHTQYSFLDGAIRIDDLVERTAELGMPAVAVTDHGNMFGAIYFYKMAMKKGIKPILGCEMYVALDGMEVRNRRDSAHLVLLARNEEGYRNLLYLNSMAWLKGFYYDPRIDKELLRQHSKGLIGLSACLGGEVPELVRRQDLEGARRAAAEYRDIFEPGCYYLEIMRNGFPELEAVNKALVEIGRELDIPLVATNDCHYLEEQDAYAQEALMAIATGKTLDDESRLRHDTSELYFKPAEVMTQQFADLPECIENSLKIAEQCNVELTLGKPDLPNFPVPEGYTLDSYLVEQANLGLDQRMEATRASGLPIDEAAYRDRLKTELDIILSMGFAGYFLIVWDFIRYARQNGIPVGPGRGSGAGSLVAYSLGITDIDPIPYGLLFERFLNPDRVSMPDFDIDFCQNRRDEVIKYVSSKYHEDKVSQIVTFAVLKAKSVIRDVGRVMGLPYSEVDAIAKLVPEGLKVTLADSMKDKAFREKVESNETYRKLIEIALRLEGLNRQAGTHAAGVVIGNRPLWEYAPLYRGTEGEVTTQYAKLEVEDVGLVKFDFLGLTTLTVIDEAVRHINRQRRLEGEPDFRIDKIPLDDAPTFRMIGAGDTSGVFQLESSGFTDLVKRFQPTRFEEIIALVALFRPGPIGAGMVDDFVDRKHGRKKVEYPHSSLQDLLEETYGTIIYQEQVMQIARELAGFSLGQADLLRRAMGKKEDKVMAQQRIAFIDGASNVGTIGGERAGQIFDMLAEFAKYGFNKSHSAAYALISYQTAWLKCHHPVEFMAAILSASMNDTTKVVRYINETRNRGVEVLPPDVNESDVDFRVSEGKIRFGLGAIKGVGESVVNAILEAREDGPFDSLFNFCERVDLRRVNKKTLEVLIKCGAFDSLEVGRARLLAAAERAVDLGQRKAEERNSSQLGIFGLLASPASSGSPAGTMEEAEAPQYPEVEEWPVRERLRLEKEYLGFYLTGHPMDNYRNHLSRLGVVPSGDLGSYSDGSTISLAGVVTELRERRAKRGNGTNGFAMLEDLAGKTEILCFGEAYEQARELLHGDDPVVISGNLLVEGDDRRDFKIRVRTVRSLPDVIQEVSCKVQLIVDTARHPAHIVEGIRALMEKYPGNCQVYMKMTIPGESEVLMGLPDNWKVESSRDFLEAACALLGDDSIQLA